MSSYSRHQQSTITSSAENQGLSSYPWSTGWEIEGLQQDFEAWKFETTNFSSDTFWPLPPGSRRRTCPQIHSLGYDDFNDPQLNLWLMQLRDTYRRIGVGTAVPGRRTSAANTLYIWKLHPSKHHAASNKQELHLDSSISSKFISWSSMFFVSRCDRKLSSENVKNNVIRTTDQVCSQML